MLFDLRGRGRRRTVQVIYLGLAILLGAGLVLFGVGGAVGGGLFDALDQNSSSVTNKTFEKKVQSAQAQVTRTPTDAAAWAALAKARYQLAGVGKNYNETTGVFTDQGKAELQLVSDAWQRYLALNPKNPDTGIARQMVGVYGASGLNRPDDVVTAWEIVVDSSPANPNNYANLAIYAIQANQTRKAELAEQKALSLETDKIKRAQIKQAIAQARQQVAQDAAQSTGTTSGQ